jgi:hypothetical protein
MSDQWDFEHEAAQMAYVRSIEAEFSSQWEAENRVAAYEAAIEEFTEKRLQSYYLANPDLAKPAYNSLRYAQSLRPSHPTAAFIFAFIASELALKALLLRPIVFGLVHTQDMATLITDIIVRRPDTEFAKLLNLIIRKFCGVDLTTYKRPGSAETLQKEIAAVKEARNRVMHQGYGLADDSTCGPTCNVAMTVATELLNEIFPKVLLALKLDLDDSMTILTTNN